MLFKLYNFYNLDLLTCLSGFLQHGLHVVEHWRWLRFGFVCLLYVLFEEILKLDFFSTLSFLKTKREKCFS